MALWTVACQALLSMELSRQEYWSGVPFLFQGIFPTQGSNPGLLHILHWQADYLLLVQPGKLHLPNVCVCWLLSHVQLFATPWAVASQAPLSMKFSRQEYWSGSPFPSPGDLPDPGIEPGSPSFEANSLPSEPPGSQIAITQSIQYLSNQPRLSN